MGLHPRELHKTQYVSTFWALELQENNFILALSLTLVSGLGDCYGHCHLTD